MENNSDTGTVKKKRGRPPKPKTEETKPKRRYTVSQAALAAREKGALSCSTKVAITPEGKDYNARLIDHVLRISEIASHADKSDILSLRSCFLAYLQLCQEDGFAVSNLAAYASMGFCNHTNFASFEKSTDNPERKAFCAFVRQTCSVFRENMVADSKLNPVIGIFWQRNFDGLRNDTEQVQNPNGQDEDEFSNGSYKEKYKNLIGR